MDPKPPVVPKDFEFTCRYQIYSIMNNTLMDKGCDHVFKFSSTLNMDYNFDNCVKPDGKTLDTMSIEVNKKDLYIGYFNDRKPNCEYRNDP